MYFLPQCYTLKLKMFYNNKKTQTYSKVYCACMNSPLEYFFSFIIQIYNNKGFKNLNEGKTFGFSVGFYVMLYIKRQIYANLNLNLHSIKRMP